MNTQTTYTEQLQVRLQQETAALLAAVDPDARNRISRRLQAIKQAIAQDRADI